MVTPTKAMNSLTVKFHIFNTTNRIAIYSLCCLRALVYMSHGVAEHMGRYQQLGQKLSENGILAEGHDHGED